MDLPGRQEAQLIPQDLKLGRNNMGKCEPLYVETTFALWGIVFLEVGSCTPHRDSLHENPPTNLLSFSNQLHFPDLREGEYPVDSHECYSYSLLFLCLHLCCVAFSYIILVLL